MTPHESNARLPRPARRRRRTVLALSLIIAAALTAGIITALPAAAVTAAPVYVDQASIGGACSDARAYAAAQSATTPVCSIARGLAIAPSGGSVVVRAGTYPALTVSSTAGRTGYVTVVAQAGEVVSLPSIWATGGASWLRFQGLHLTGDSRVTFGVQEGGSQHIQLRGSDVRSDGPDAIELRWGVDDVLIEGNTINSRPPGATGGGNGITLTSTDPSVPGVPPGSTLHPPITNVVIRNNRLDGIGTDGIRPANFQNLTIEGNEITGIKENGEHNDALQVVFGGKHLIFRGNYLHDNAGQGFFIKDGRVEDALIENNVIVHNTLASSFQVFETVGLVIRNNTIWDNDTDIVLRPGVKDVQIYNNVAEGISVYGETSNDVASFEPEITQDFNIVGTSSDWGARGTHDVRAQAKFVNAAADDYRLAPGSPGIDAADASVAPTFDKACRSRWDDPATSDRGAGVPTFVDAGALERGPDSAAGDTAAAVDPGCTGGPLILPPGQPAPGGQPGGGPAPSPCCSGSGAPAGSAGGCAACVAKGAVAAIRVSSARLRGRDVRLVLRAAGACRFAIIAQAGWTSAGRPGIRRRATLRRTAAARGPAAAATVRLRLPRSARHARRVTLRLAVRATSCNGGVPKTSRRVLTLRR